MIHHWKVFEAVITQLKFQANLPKDSTSTINPFNKLGIAEFKTADLLFHSYIRCPYKLNVYFLTVLNLKHEFWESSHSTS